MLESNGVRTAAISYDQQEILSAFAQKHSIGFPLLSDKGSNTIRAFGIFNYNMAPELRSYGVPHPVEYLSAPDGTVVKKYFVPNYQHRVTGSAVAMSEFGTVDFEAPVVNLQNGALAAQIGLASGRAFSGQEVGFFARFALQRGWHVYGTPLPQNYTPTSINFESPSIASQQIELPAAQMLDFPNLGEKLPVFSGSFQATGMVLLKHPLPDGRLVLPGRLAFQQCSDTICEPPQMLPFELSLILEPFVITERDKKLQEQTARS